MPSKVSKEKANQAVEEYLKNGFNKTKAVKKVSNYGGRNANGQATRDFNRYLKVCDIEIDKVDEAWIADKLVYYALKAKKEPDRLRALELLGKFRAMFTDKSQVDTTMSLTAKDEAYIKGRLGLS